MPFDCELVLRENGDETRQPHKFDNEVRPGTTLHVESRDWIIIEIAHRSGLLPEVICHSAHERT
jgi:hypothetical protein